MGQGHGNVFPTTKNQETIFLEFVSYKTALCFALFFCQDSEEKTDIFEQHKVPIFTLLTYHFTPLISLAFFCMIKNITCSKFARHVDHHK